MKIVLKSIGIWLLEQDWFRFEITKKVTSIIDGTSTKKDDNVVNFIKRNRVELLAIVKREVKLSSSTFDDQLLKSIQETK